MKKTNFYHLLMILVAFMFTVSVASADYPRKYLVEEATNSGCPPCAALNPGLEAFINANSDLLVPVMYHSNYPDPNDPFYNTDVNMNVARYNTYYGINAFPTVVFYGVKQNAGSGLNYPSFFGDLTALRATTSPLNITINDQRTGTSGTVKVTVSSTQAISGKKLRIVINEYNVPFNGSNGEKNFMWVARKMLPDYNGTALTVAAGDSVTITQNYNLSGSWVTSQVYITAFVQDDGTKEVLQAGSNVKTATATISLKGQKYLKIDKNSQVVETFTLTNNGSSPLNTNLSISTDATKTYIPAGWSTVLSDKSISLTPGASKDVTVTLKSDGSTAYATVSLQSDPISSTFITVQSFGTFNALTSDTKYVAYYDGTAPGAALTANAISSVAPYNSSLVVLPMGSEIYTAYPPANFECALFSFNYYTRGLLGGDLGAYGSEVTALFNAINSMISAGKKLFITSELDLIYANGTNGSPASLNFFNNTLGISPNGNPTMRITVNSSGQITAVNTYPCKGVTNDSVGGVLNTTFNQYSTSWQYFIIYTDFIKINSGSPSKPIMYYDNNQASIGGVRAEIGQSRIVYLTSGMEAIADQGARTQFATKIMNWLFANASAPKGPQISFNNSSITFDSVIVNNTKNMTLTIKNTGDLPLKITSMTMDPVFDPSGAFTLPSVPTFPFTVPAGNSIDLLVSFKPTDVVDYSGSLTITSNSTTNSQQIISLDGKGYVSSGPIIATDLQFYDFGVIKLGASNIQNIKIKNTGNATLNVSKIELTKNEGNTFVLVTGTQALQIPANGSKTFQVKFTPAKAAMTYNGQVTITSDAANKPAFTADLVGQGDPMSVPSEIISNDGVLTIKATPNPVSDRATIEYKINGTTAKNLTIRLHDMSGRIINTLVDESAVSGVFTHQFESAELVSGTYYIIATFGESSVEMPIVIVK